MTHKKRIRVPKAEQRRFDAALRAYYACDHSTRGPISVAQHIVTRMLTGARRRFERVVAMAMRGAKRAHVAPFPRPRPRAVARRARATRVARVAAATIERGDDPPPPSDVHVPWSKATAAVIGEAALDEARAQRFGWAQRALLLAGWNWSAS